jgi:hypothetical protein
VEVGEEGRGVRGARRWGVFPAVLEKRVGVENFVSFTFFFTCKTTTKNTSQNNQIKISFLLLQRSSFLSLAFLFLHDRLMRVEAETTAGEQELKRAAGEGAKEQRRSTTTTMAEASTSDLLQPQEPRPQQTSTTSSPPSAAGAVAASVARALSAEPELAQLSAVQNSTWVRPNSFF